MKPEQLCARQWGYGLIFLLLLNNGQRQKKKKKGDSGVPDVPSALGYTKDLAEVPE